MKFWRGLPCSVPKFHFGTPLSVNRKMKDAQNSNDFLTKSQNLNMTDYLIRGPAICNIPAIKTIPEDLKKPDLKYFHIL